MIAGLFCAFHPLLLRYVPSLHLESLLTFLVTLLVWCTVRFYFERTVLNGVLVGVVAGLARAHQGGGVCPTRRSSSWRMLLVDPGGAAPRGEAVPVPWGSFVAIGAGDDGRDRAVDDPQLRHDGSLRTGVVGHQRRVPARHDLQPHRVRHAAASRRTRSPRTRATSTSSGSRREAGTEWERDDYETDQILNEEAKRVLRDGAARCGAQVVRRALHLLVPADQPARTRCSLWPARSARGRWRSSAGGGPDARGDAVWPLLLPVFYLNIVLALLLALGRYSAPILPALLVVSAFGADTLLRPMARRAVPEAR